MPDPSCRTKPAKRGVRDWCAEQPACKLESERQRDRQPGGSRLTFQELPVERHPRHEAIDVDKPIEAPKPLLRVLQHEVQQTELVSRQSERGPCGPGEDERLQKKRRSIQLTRLMRFHQSPVKLDDVPERVNESQMKVLAPIRQRRVRGWRLVARADHHVDCCIHVCGGGPAIDVPGVALGGLGIEHATQAAAFQDNRSDLLAFQERDQPIALELGFRGAATDLAKERSQFHRRLGLERVERRCPLETDQRQSKDAQLARRREECGSDRRRCSVG